MACDSAISLTPCTRMRITFLPTRQLAISLAPVVMHRASPRLCVDLRLEGGDLLVIGRCADLYTPATTNDSMCLCVTVSSTGDTLLIGDRLHRPAERRRGSPIR